MKKNVFKKINIALLLLALTASSAQAQLRGDHLLGDMGLAAGTQAPPSVIAFLPLYDYNTSKFVDKNGDSHSIPSTNSFLLGAGAGVVTNFKILGGNYGANLLFAFMSSRIEGNETDTKSGLGFSDTYVQPLQLGWHFEKADLTVGYGLYMPTGRYEYGGDNNKGMGMWTNEFSVGSTYYFDKRKTLNFATTAFYEIHSHKKGTDLKPGSILALEGGLSKTFYKKVSGTPVPMTFNVGPVYYMQFKMTDDKRPTLPVADPSFFTSKDHIYGVGLEANVLLPKTFTSISLRWLTETGARNRFEGNSFFITIGQFLASLEKKKK